MTIGKVIVWLIVGALAGTVVGRLVTFSKEGFGFWTNLIIGMLGAMIGGYLFHVFNINFQLGELKITFEDLVSAIAGSLICVVAWWLIRKGMARKNAV